MKKFYRIIYYFGGVLLFVVVAVVGYTQTSTFKNFLHNVILQETKSAINGEIVFGDIEGNLITGFSVNEIVIRDSLCNVFHSNKIEVKYDIFGFIFKNVGISNARIYNPKIRIYRSIGGTYNIENLIIPSTTDTTPSGWTVNVKRLELVDADIEFTDSLLLHRRAIGISDIPSYSVIDYARVHLKNLSLVTSALIKKDNYSLKIRELSFNMDRPNFVLNKLSGGFSLNRNEVSAENLIILTNNSHLRIDASLKNVDITKISVLEELQNKKISLSFLAHNLDTKELKQFLYPWVDFLDKNYRIRIKAEGAFGNFYVDQLSLQLPQSVIQLQGQIKNLHQPKNLEMNINGIDSFVNPQDLITCLPGLHLPDLKRFGITSFSLNYNGRPLDFNAQIMAKTSVGEFKIDGKMKIEPKNIIYSGNIETNYLALGSMLENENIHSNINAKVSVDASGFSLHSMTGIARVEIDSSSFNNLDIKNSILIFDIADATIRAHVMASVGSGNYELSSNIKFVNNDSLDYRINGRIKSVDLAEILKNEQYESDLSFELFANGAIGNVIRSDTIGLQFYRSKYNKEFFESSKVGLKYSVFDSANSSLQLTSDVADLILKGSFTPGSFISLLDNSYRILTEAVKYRINSLNVVQPNVITISNIADFNFKDNFHASPFKATFTFNIKNLKPFGTFLRVPLSGVGAIEGNAICDSSEINIAGVIMSESFGCRAIEDTLSADSIKIVYDFANLRPNNFFSFINGNIKTDLHNFKINSLLFNQVVANLLIKSESLNVNFYSFIDSTAKISFNGATKINTDLLELQLPQFKIELGNYIAENVDTVKMGIGKDGFNFESLKLEHESGGIVLFGQFRPNGISNVNFSVKDFLLSDLKSILHRSSYASSATQFGGIVEASLGFRGSFDNPKITVELNADGVRAEDWQSNKSKVLGRINSRLYYNEHLLNIYIKFMSKPENIQTEPDLLLMGSLPFDLGLTRESSNKLEGEVELLLQSAGMNLEFLDPFIPEISILSGTMTCDMRMKGQIDAPNYEGNMAIRNTNIILHPVGIQYIINGDLVPAGDKIQFENFTIQNVRKPRLNVGTMKISGGFTLLGLNLKQFDIRANGDLTVMTEERRIRGQKLYGNLFAATGADGILWQGNLDASLVRGQIYLKYADLVLPPERESELMQASMINVIFKDDTSKQVRIFEEKVVFNFNGKNGSKNNSIINNQPSSTASVSGSTTSSFFDRMDYDLSIETQGPTTLRFVFNTQTSEELYADLQGKLNFNKTAEASRITGQVQVGNRSYYNFIKKFEASGKLLFTGDIINPELDIVATYQGTRDTAAINASNYSAVHIQSGGMVAGTSSAPQVLVTLKITGTRNEPKTKIILETKGYSDKDWIAWKEGDDEANAISYIITGQFRNELTDQQRMGLIGTNLGFALASSMVMGPISEAARRATYGVIQSVDVLYYGGQMSQSTDLRLTGQVGEAVIRAGGRVLNDIGNANVSVELPFSAIVNSDRYRNLILTLERRVEGVQNTMEEQRRATNGARLFYRIIF